MQINTLSMMTLALIGALATPAMAQNHKTGSTCEKDGRTCQTQKSQNDQAKPGQTQRQVTKHQPKVGDSARSGRTFQQAAPSRLPTPPNGQHYRVVDDQVVRVDSNTLKVVAVAGLLTDLMK